MTEQEQWPRWSDSHGYIRRWPETGPVSCCLPGGSFLDHDKRFDNYTGEERWQNHTVGHGRACTEAHVRSVLAARGQKVPAEWETPEPGPLPGPWQEHRLPDGRTLKWTGEFREPQAGEWYVASDDRSAVLTSYDIHAHSRYILRPTSDPEPATLGGSTVAVGEDRSGFRMPEPAPDADGWCYGVDDRDGQVFRWRECSGTYDWMFPESRSWTKGDGGQDTYCRERWKTYRTCTRAEAEKVHGKPLPAEGKTEDDNEPPRACPAYEGDPNDSAFTKPQARKETMMTDKTPKRSLPARLALAAGKRLGLWTLKIAAEITVALVLYHHIGECWAFVQDPGGMIAAWAGDAYAATSGWIGAHWQALAGVAASGLCLLAGKRWGRKA